MKRSTRAGLFQLGLLGGGFAIASVLVTSVMGLLMGAFGMDVLERPGVHMGLQVVWSALVFLLPTAALYYYLSINEVKPIHLGRFPWPLCFFALLLPFVAIPAIEWVSELNAMIPVGGTFSGLEEELTDFTNRLLYVDSFGQFLVNVLVAAVVPAICEEFFFRGALLKVVGTLSGNRHVAVWVTALVFSLIHLQLLTALPRVILGVMLGYFYVYGRSIWLSVLGHGVNNLMVVLMYYVSALRGVPVEELTNGHPPALWLGLLSLVGLLAGLLYLPRLANRYVPQGEVGLVDENTERV